MSRRIDIGVASYGNSSALTRTLASIRENTAGQWRCFIIDNPGPDPETAAVIRRFAEADSRFVPVFMPENVGYAGAVNELFRRAETEYLLYSDNDVMIRTPSWDEHLVKYLDRHHEIGMVFPGEQPYLISRVGWSECMWGLGCCWAINRLAMADTGHFDTELGHQEEADYALRLRMAGWCCACAPEVRIEHEAAASTNPESIERINRGVVRWVNKWCRYFGGARLGYQSRNVLRWEDWPPNALYLEEYWLQRVPGLNLAPEVHEIDGRLYDLIRVPRLSGFYRGRII